MDSEWTGESIAAVIIVPLIILILGVVGWLLRRRAQDEDRESAFSDYWMFQGFAIVCWVTIPIVVISFWWSMFPWKTEYHQWQPKSGIVSKVDQRLLNATGKFVVSFQGSDQQYGVIDTRAAGIEVGDQLTITCVRRWQWSGTHGYDCNFVSLESGKR